MVTFAAVLGLLIQLFVILAGPISWVVIAAAAKRAADHYCGKDVPSPKKSSRLKAVWKALIHPSGS